METLNRNQSRSLNGNLNGNLNENQARNLNRNLNGNLNGNLWRKLEGNLNEPNLGPNWNQTWTNRVAWGVLERSLMIPGCSLGGPWRVLGGSLGALWRGPLGAKLGAKTGLAPVRHQGP